MTPGPSMMGLGFGGTEKKGIAPMAGNQARKGLLPGESQGGEQRKGLPPGHCWSA